jgi:adenylyltransferase/sulfurtransferase
MTDPELTSSDRERFDRTIRLAEVGEAGQRRLLASTVAVIGAGGLGSAAILYLVAAGVGRLRIADSERLEPSNLNRQVIHRASSLGRLKAESAREAVLALNPACRVEIVTDRITEASAGPLLGGADVVLDCTDNFPTRLLVADACWRAGVPLVTAAVLRFEGQLLSVIPTVGSPCYRCLVPEEPPADASPGAVQVGILGAVAGAMGALQALEAVKVILGIGENLAHRMLIWDGLRGTFRTVRRTREPACRTCGTRTAADR